MFERFTENARQVVVLAQDEARMLKHNYIGTEHLLLGLFRVDDGVAARALASLDIDLDEVRARVRRIVGQGDELTIGQIPFTPRAKRVLELSLREAVSLGHSYIGTEHILLGLARENEGVAARILLDFDADAEKVRDTVLSLVDQGTEAPAADPELAAELDRVRREKEAAIEEHEFERAAELRDRERHLERRLRGLPELEPWRGTPLEIGGGRVVIGGRPNLLRWGMQRGTADYATISSQPPLLLGWLLFAVALGVGILVGWLIWG